MDATRPHPIRTERVLARALSTALDPTISGDARVDAVARVAHGDRKVLEAALARLDRETAGHRGLAATRAATSLQLAMLDAVAHHPAHHN
ncbi:MAG: hypothetical protein KDB35_20610 [Acidimicrobiales bacterium]|nr:hypothetical protein [Acidimicrobiales bacterium]MCB9371225.1 hypothetical protein [Microthrixaceae bacterium]